MRKGTMRKAKDESKAAAATTSSSQQNPIPKPRAKRTKPSHESEPQYFKDKRNMEDLWKEAFPVGTEWDQLAAVYKYNWNFKNLEDAFEEGGKLHGEKVYLFGCTEPQLVPLRGGNKLTVVRAVVVVVSPFPPYDKIGINSVQREKEEILPMKQMKMAWVPYILLERRSALKHLKIDCVKKYEYCLPCEF